MARPSKIQKEMFDKAEIVEQPATVVDNSWIIENLTDRITALEEMLKEKAAPKHSTINKMETFNSEVEPELPPERSMGMDYSDKLASMLNAIKILPPNMIKDGKHSKENIGAICGFIVTDEMLEAIYSDFKHDED